MKGADGAASTITPHSASPTTASPAPDEAPSPLRTTFPPAALATCHSRGLPTQRRHRSDPNATSRTRSPRCGGALSPPLPELSRDALVATRRSARRHEFPITDAVRLADKERAAREVDDRLPLAYKSDHHHQTVASAVARMSRLVQHVSAELIRR